jgi:hypothetical protein
MGYRIDYRADEGVLVVEVQGPLDGDLLGRCTPEMVAMMQKHNCTRVLLDYRAAQPKLSTLEIWERPQAALSLGLPAASWIAMLASERTDDYDFVETVAKSAGLRAEVFVDIHQALGWLQDEEAAAERCPESPAE